MRNNKLIAVFAKYGDNICAAAKKVEMNKNTLYKKVAGITDFTAPEIVRVKNAYSLTADEIEAIFFT